MDAYISLMMVAIFLAAAEGFSRINKNHVMDAMCIASAIMTTWVFAQGCGELWPKGNFVGPFNPDTGSVFMALLIPGFFRKDRWHGLWFAIPGVLMAGTTTGFVAMIAACIIALAMHSRALSLKRAIVFPMAVVIVAGIWFWKIDPIQGSLGCTRWTVWKHAAWAMRSEMLGRGLGSWKIKFPLLASGEKRLGSVTNENGKIKMGSVFLQAHNEYVQTAFELGAQTALLIGIFLTWAAISICRGQVPVYAAGGMAALTVSCMGWHVFHIAPLALVGCAWLGMSVEQKKSHAKAQMR